jgi:hypothetical protein
MDNLSTAGSADFGSLIGALELNHPVDFHDGALEAAGTNASPTRKNLTCPGDDVLLRAADITMAGPITGQPWTGACCGR